MSDAFDGASKKTGRDPGFRTAIIMLIVLVLVVAGLLLAASWALKDAGADGINPGLDAPQLVSP
jgi:hypothetical protein